MSEKKVLVVDDETAILAIMREALEMEGYTVATAASAEDALEILAGDSFPVIFLDLRLPGMDGVELCGNIRKDNPVAVIYAFTGYTNYYTLSSIAGQRVSMIFLSNPWQ